jgi:hypothetical protein
MMILGEGKCRYCGQEIVWSENPKTHKKLPLDKTGEIHFGTCSGRGGSDAPAPLEKPVSPEAAAIQRRDLSEKTGYTITNESRCGCGARVWWGARNGKSCPFDSDGTSHFVTCPDREKYRKGKHNG